MDRFDDPKFGRIRVAEIGIRVDDFGNFDPKIVFPGQDNPISPVFGAGVGSDIRIPKRPDTEYGVRISTTADRIEPKPAPIDAPSKVA